MKRLSLIATCIYGLFLFYVLFGRSMGCDHDCTYVEYIKSMRNFIPLKSFYILFSSPIISRPIVFSFLKNLLGNIILFIPFGVMLPLWFDLLKKFKRFFIVAFVSIFIVECIQLFTMLGCFDIEDILLNLFGACIGFMCHQKLFTAKKQENFKSAQVV